MWLHQACSHRVQVDVIGERPIMVGVGTVHGHRLVAIAKQSAPGAVTPVVAAGDGVLQPTHPSDQIGLRSFNEQVVVIAHKHLGMDPPTGHHAGLRQSGEEEPPVIIVMENRFAPVATRHQVVKCTGKLDPKTAWHGGSLESLGKF